MSLAEIVTAGRNMPQRILFYACPGFGKTSFAAQFPDPIFVMDPADSGLETLIDAKQLPETPHFPPVAVQTWEDLLWAIKTLTTESHAYKTLVIDTGSGFERTCHEYVCKREFAGDWGEHGFISFNKGFVVSLAEWRKLLIALDSLREQKGMTIVFLCHSVVQPFKNPEGPDYDRYEPDMHRKTWGLTHKWADMVLFGNYNTAVETSRAGPKDATVKGKGKGGTDRFLYTERTAAYEAKNRHGLPNVIKLGNSPQEAYAAFVAALEAGK